MHELIGKAREKNPAKWGIAILVLLILGLILVFIIRQLAPEPAPPFDETALRASLDQFGSVPYLWGVVKELKVTGFTFEVEAINGIIIPKISSFSLRDVIISSGTQIYEKVARDPIQIQRDSEAYEELLRQGKRGLPPALYEARLVSRNNLKVGDVVTVSVDTGTDLKYAQVIEAKSIIIQE